MLVLSSPTSPTPAPHTGRGGWISILVGDDDPHQSLYRFDNVFHTPISVVDWSHDGTILLVGSMTGEVVGLARGDGRKAASELRCYAFSSVLCSLVDELLSARDGQAPTRLVVLVLFGIVFLLTLIILVGAMSGAF